MPPKYQDAAEDAEELYEAMKGFGTDDSTLIDIICDRQPYQLEQISEAFEAEHDKPLIKKIKSEIRGDYEKFLVALLQSRKDYLLDTLKGAVEGLGTDERALIDCLVCCEEEDLSSVRESEVYNAIMNDVSGDFKKVLKSLFEADREECDRVPNLARASKDMKRFYRATEAKFGTNDRKLIQLIKKRSNGHLHLVDRIYQKVHNKTLEDVVKSETRGSYEKVLCALLKPFDIYWAERCHKAMDGLGTDDEALIRCFILCGKNKIPYVAAKYKDIYGKSLADDVEGETSGDYGKALKKYLKPTSKATLTNPLAAFQEISIDEVDEEGDIEVIVPPTEPVRITTKAGGAPLQYFGPENEFFLIQEAGEGKYVIQFASNRDMDGARYMQCVGTQFKFSESYDENDESLWFSVVPDNTDGAWNIITSEGYRFRNTGGGNWSLAEDDHIEGLEDALILTA